MNRWMYLGFVFGCAASVAWAAEPAVRPFADYQIILDRKPFGTPPEVAPQVERVIPVGESFAATLQLSGIYELEDGNLRIAITDRKDNTYFTLVMGGKPERGIEVLDIDYDKEKAILQKDGQAVELSMGDVAASEVIPTGEIQGRRQQGEERRLSYAERRRLRMIERQKPLEPPPAPVLTGEALEKHMQEYQMEILRGGTLPPLPVQLSPENDAILVQEGVLPPVDDEGYEYEEEDEYDEYYE